MPFRWMVLPSRYRIARTIRPDRCSGCGLALGGSSRPCSLAIAPSVVPTSCIHHGNPQTIARTDRKDRGRDLPIRSAMTMRALRSVLWVIRSMYLWNALCLLNLTMLQSCLKRPSSRRTALGAPSP